VEHFLQAWEAPVLSRLWHAHKDWWQMGGGSVLMRWWGRPREGPQGPRLLVLRVMFISFLQGCSRARQAKSPGHKIQGAVHLQT
jgi:hypothetical protein